MIVDTVTSNLIAEFRRGSTAALARMISMVENGEPASERILAEVQFGVGAAYRIGITGAPGVGKSTLTGRVIQEYRRRGMTIGCVVVDPTSRLSGGALLGDRIRMAKVATDEGVFIRSMATRGALGGLASATRQVCDVLDGFGFDRIIVETVGVGQSDLTVTEVTDTTVLLLVPESGDSVQVLKAGILEVADLFVVNKADRSGADYLAKELRGLAEIREAAASPPRPGGGRNPQVLKTVATENTGVVELVDALETLRE